MFKNFKLSTKIVFGFAVPLLMISGIATAIFVVVSNVQSGAVLAKDESAVFAGVAQQMNEEIPLKLLLRYQRQEMLYLE